MITDMKQNLLKQTFILYYLIPVVVLKYFECLFGIILS